MPTPGSRLRLLAPSAGPCATPGCPLPGQAVGGFCPPCASVQAGVVALSQRLLARDLARLELQAPGLTATALLALRANGPDRARQTGTGRNGLMTRPDRGELAALDALLAELRSRGTAP